MVKKKFIEKKNAVTYSLVYRSTEDVDDVPERMLVEADKGVGVGKVDAGVAQAGQDAAAGARRWGQPPPLLRYRRRLRLILQPRQRVARRVPATGKGLGDCRRPGL